MRCVNYFRINGLWNEKLSHRWGCCAQHSMPEPCANLQICIPQSWAERGQRQQSRTTPTTMAATPTTCTMHKDNLLQIQRRDLMQIRISLSGRISRARSIFPFEHFNFRLSFVDIHPQSRVHVEMTDITLCILSRNEIRRILLPRRYSIFLAAKTKIVQSGLVCRGIHPTTECHGKINKLRETFSNIFTLINKIELELCWATEILNRNSNHINYYCFASTPTNSTLFVCLCFCVLGKLFLRQQNWNINLNVYSLLCVHNHGGADGKRSVRLTARTLLTNHTHTPIENEIEFSYVRRTSCVQSKWLQPSKIPRISETCKSVS